MWQAPDWGATRGTPPCGASCLPLFRVFGEDAKGSARHFHHRRKISYNGYLQRVEKCTRRGQTLLVRAADPIFLLWLIPNTHGAFGFQDASEIPAHESPAEGWSLSGAFARLGLGGAARRRFFGPSRLRPKNQVSGNHKAKHKPENRHQYSRLALTAVHSRIKFYTWSPHAG